jgi:hypothetical protein
MMYEEVVRDFAARTQKNLSVIERLLKNGEEVFEATQLVNSMLGLLVFPREEFIKQIPQTPLSELKKSGWPIPRVLNGFPQVNDLRELVRYLRNAIAHFNIKFIGDGSNEIRLLKVWNTNPNTGKKTWEAELSPSDLRAIGERFVDLLLGGGRPTSR